MVCLSCTATGERVMLAAEGFGNRHCFLENIADKNVPPDLSQCVFVIEQALSVRALQELVTAAGSESVCIHLVCILSYYAHSISNTKKKSESIHTLAMRRTESDGAHISVFIRITCHLIACLCLFLFQNIDSIGLFARQNHQM